MYIFYLLSLLPQAKAQEIPWVGLPLPVFKVAIAAMAISISTRIFIPNFFIICVNKI
jgi:hypothetical protein